MKYSEDVGVVEMSQEESDQWNRNHQINEIEKMIRGIKEMSFSTNNEDHEEDLLNAKSSAMSSLFYLYKLI